MDSSTVMIELSPLDQIRRAEAEVTRRIAAARQAAEAAVKEAQTQAADLKRQSRELGHREGLAQCQEIISQAEQKAHALIAQAQSQASTLRRTGDLYIENAVRSATAIVIGQETEADSA